MMRLIVLSALLATALSSPTGDKPRTFSVCETEACKLAAERVVAHVNESADPCDDWYLYACGNFAQKNPLNKGSSIQALSLIAQANEQRLDLALDEEALKTHGSKVVRKVKQLYDQCVGKSQDDAFMSKVRDRNLKFLLEMREKVIEYAARSDVNTFVPVDVPSEEELLLLSAKPKTACRQTVQVKYDYAVTRAFLDKFLDAEAAAAARKMINNVHEAILNRLNIQWATEKERKKYRAKLNELERNLVYPDWIADDSELDREYGENLVDTIDELLETKAVHPSWTMPILLVNAHFNPSVNEITIPAGILQDLVYNKDTVPALNYGGAGFISGHEMSHALNAYFGGSRGESPALNCISNQLTSLKEPQTGSKYWTGRFLLSEALADVGGINASLVALNANEPEDVRLPGAASKFTPTQLFFLSEANSWCHHSTDSFIKNTMFLPLGHPFNYHRVVVPAMNSPAFAEAFNCPAGSRMNPVEKCRLW